MDRRRVNWALVSTLALALIGWGGFGLVAWGSTTSQVNAHEKRLEKIEATYVTERDMSSIGQTIDKRLTRIEGQLDRLESNFRRPQP